MVSTPYATISPRPVFNEKEIRQLENQLSEFKKYSLQKMGLEETFELIEKK